MKRKTEPNSPEDQIVAALEADLIRFELWALEAIGKTAHKVHYKYASSRGARPVYVLARMAEAIVAISNNPRAAEEPKRAAYIMGCIPWLWSQLESNKPSWEFAQAVSAFASAVPTPKAAQATSAIVIAAVLDQGRAEGRKAIKAATKKRRAVWKREAENILSDEPYLKGQWEVLAKKLQGALTSKSDAKLKNAKLPAVRTLRDYLIEIKGELAPPVSLA